MLRILLVLVLLGSMALITLPFLMSSLYVDQRGVEISGHVFSRREDAVVQYSNWYRSCEITVEYEGQDEAGVSFIKVELPPDQYDSFHKGQEVKLHYLRRQDVPNVPFAKTLREIGVLPRARLAGQRMFSDLMLPSNESGLLALESIGVSILFLVLWHLFRLPRFSWAVAACVLGSLTLALIGEFPMPTPTPARDVRRATGRVKSVERIARLFSGRRTKGDRAAQPVSVVGVEFLPEGRSDEVLAVDLIDEGSIPSKSLKQGSTLSLDYELASPRIAYLVGATRNFPRRNIGGLVVAWSLAGAVLLGALFGLRFLGSGLKRIVKGRPRS